MHSRGRCRGHANESPVDRERAEAIPQPLRRSHPNRELLRDISGWYNYQFDIAVISVHLEDGHSKGVKVLQQLRASESKTCAVILVDGDERDFVVGASCTGARGVFCLGESFRAPLKCIRCVHEGQIWASNAELESLREVITKLNPIRIHNAGGMALLTRREQDVVRLVAEGMRNKEISRKLNLREHTVPTCVFRIFEKLGISNRVELVLYALSAPECSEAPEKSRAGANHKS